MTDLIELLKKPKQWVNKCQQHLTELGYTEPYNYDRFISEELGELIGNLKSGKTPANRALLVDDIVDSTWVLLAVANSVTICLEDMGYSSYRMQALLKKYHRGVNTSILIGELIGFAHANNINWQAAFAALVEENYSKLPPIESSKELIKEIFRDNKIQKRDLEGNYYPWFKPADFSVF